MACVGSGVPGQSASRGSGLSTCRQRPRWSLFLPMTDELDGMATFVAVAEAKGFRAAGERLGLSHSAVSQTLCRLEVRRGVTFVLRSMRCVPLTEVISRLYRAVLLVI